MILFEPYMPKRGKNYINKHSVPCKCIRDIRALSHKQINSTQIKIKGVERTVDGWSGGRTDPTWKK